MGLLVTLAIGACECSPPPPADDVGSVGGLEAVLVDGGFEVRVVDLERPIRALQVDAALTGATATSARPSAQGPRASDIVEAGLDAPKRDFTLVVSDTRRLTLPAGAVAFVETSAGLERVDLLRAVAVDDTGARRALEVSP